MTTTSQNGSASGWQTLNQEQLMWRVSLIKSKLRGDHEAIAEPDPPSSFTSAIDLLASNLALSSFELDVLTLCAGIELDAEVAGLCAHVQGNPARPYPTFGMALGKLDAPHWDALSPTGPLRRWKLIELEDSGPLTTTPLRVDETILHYLAGLQYHDDRLVGLVSEVRQDCELAASHREIAEDIRRRWSAASDPLFDEVVRLCGSDPGAHELIAASVCSALGGHVEVMYGTDLPTDLRNLRHLARLCERAARLTGTAFIVHCDERDPAADRLVAEFVDAVASVFFVSGVSPVEPLRRPSARVDVHKPTAAEQRQLWGFSLEQLAPKLNGHLDEVEPSSAWVPAPSSPRAVPF